MTLRISIASLAAGFALVFAVNAAAQDLGALKNAANGGGLDLGSLASGSAGNAAGVLQFCISNNYLGGADLTSPGLAGLADRVSGVDGRLSVESPAGGPTIIAAELPCG